MKNWRADSRCDVRLAWLSRASTFRAHETEDLLTIIFAAYGLQLDSIDFRLEYDAYARRHGLEQALYVLLWEATMGGLHSADKVHLALPKRHCCFH